MSMKPNFNPSLSLRGGNTEVAAGGPLDWNDPGGRCRIEVTITQRLGSGEVVAVSIDPKVVDPADVETLQDLIVGAIADASKQVTILAHDRLGPLAGGMGGLGLPGM